MDSVDLSAWAMEPRVEGHRQEPRRLSRLWIPSKRRQFGSRSQEAQVVNEGKGFVMLLRIIIFGACGAHALSLRPPDVSRRELVNIATAAAAAAARPARADERVISASELLSFSQTPRRKIAITGANSGVGLEGTKLLAAAGHDVICACRTLEKAEAAAKACGGTPAVCDLADLSSVRAFAKEATGLDTLVLNAGLALNTAEKEPRRTKDGFELTIGTNHLGHFLLYKLLEPDMLKRSSFRLVVTASPVHDPLSGGGKVGSAATLGDLSGLRSANFDMIDGGVYDPDKAYKDSKLANLMFAAEASRRLAKTGATCNSFSPGLIPSPNGFFKYQNPVFAQIFNLIAGVVGVSETPQFGGSCLAFMATDASLDKTTGGWYDTEPPGKHQLLQHLPSAEARDVDKQKLLWELSEKLVSA